MDVQDVEQGDITEYPEVDTVLFHILHSVMKVSIMFLLDLFLKHPLVRLTRWRNKYSRTRGRALDVREIQQQARDYNATTTKQNRQVEELPPAYTEPTAPPPPYSYY